MAVKVDLNVLSMFESGGMTHDGDGMPQVAVDGGKCRVYQRRGLWSSF